MRPPKQIMKILCWRLQKCNQVCYESISSSVYTLLWKKIIFMFWILPVVMKMYFLPSNFMYTIWVGAWQQQNDLCAQGRLRSDQPGHPSQSGQRLLCALCQTFFRQTTMIRLGEFCWSKLFCHAPAHIMYEPPHDKSAKWHVYPAKTQISLGIHPVWSESSLCAQWVAKDPKFLHADSKSEDWSDLADAQADLSLHWAHSHFVGFVMRWLISYITFQHRQLSVPASSFPHSHQSVPVSKANPVTLSPATHITTTITALGTPVSLTNSQTTAHLLAPGTPGPIRFSLKCSNQSPAATNNLIKVLKLQWSLFCNHLFFTRFSNLPMYEFDEQVWKNVY